MTTMKTKIDDKIIDREAAVEAARSLDVHTLFKIASERCSMLVVQAIEPLDKKGDKGPEFQTHEVMHGHQTLVLGAIQEMSVFANQMAIARKVQRNMPQPRSEADDDGGNRIVVPKG